LKLYAKTFYVIIGMVYNTQNNLFISLVGNIGHQDLFKLCTANPKTVQFQMLYLAINFYLNSHL